MNSEECQQLRSELAEIERLLADLPTSRTIERFGLEDRRDEITAVLQKQSDRAMIRLPRGFRCSVCKPGKGDRRRWVAHTLRREVVGKRVGGRNGAVVIAAEGWLILARDTAIP